MAKKKTKQPVIPTLIDPKVIKNFPKFTSNKVVSALEIKTVVRAMDGTAVLTPKDKKFPPFKVKKSFMLRYRAQNGGYFLVYEDGNRGFQNKELFEGSYSENKAPAKKDAPKGGAPKKDEAKKDAPKKDAPKGGAPKKDEAKK